jgi:type II secretory pathway component GspD/PulD (secretin)
MEAANKHQGRCAVLLILCLLVLPLVAYAQTTSATPPKSAPSGSPPRVSMKADLYDIDAGGTEIGLVLQALSRCSGANMVISPEVTGQVTANLTQMPLESILDYLSKVQGFAWQKAGNTYLIASKEKLSPPAPQELVAPAEQELFVWQCRNIKPADAVTTIKGLFPKITVVEGPQAATPVLTATGSGMSAGSGSSGAGVSSSESASSASTTNSTSTNIVLMGDSPDVEKAKQALSQLDVNRPQVLVKVQILEISSTGDQQIGLDWSYNDLVLSEMVPPGAGINFGKFGRQGLTATGAISALVKDGSARLLAQPNMAVLDGECASILIGDRILFPKLIGYSQYGTPLFDKEEEKVGIYLQIAAKLTDKDQIVMTVYPQVSLVTSYLKTQGGEYPQISTREAKTTVSVKNSETLAIGGLLRDDDIKSGSKVPLLGDLPIIGQLFRRTKTTKEHTEIIILLTPTLASQD